MNIIGLGWLIVRSELLVGKRIKIEYIKTGLNVCRDIIYDTI